MEMDICIHVITKLEQRMNNHHKKFNIYVLYCGKDFMLFIG